jgi:hypothetical protein
MRAELLCEAVELAHRRGLVDPDAIFHSDSEYEDAGAPGPPDPHSDGRTRMSVPGCSRAS